VAIRTLEDQFGDHDETARELRLKLQRLPQARDSNAVKDLQLNVEVIIQQLTNMGKIVASEETMLLIDQKLPYKYMEKMLAKKKTAAAGGP
jgi:hypothetical protein